MNESDADGIIVGIKWCFKFIVVMFIVAWIFQIFEGDSGTKKNPLAGSESEWRSLSTQEKADRIEREMRRQGAR